MFENILRRQATVTTVIGVLIAIEAITFLLAALSHLGVPLPLGLTEPRIIPATIVEGLCGIFLMVSAYAVFTRQTQAWGIAIAAHVFSVVGVLLGIISLALRLGPNTEVNTIYHRVILVVLVAVLVGLLTPISRAALSRSNRASQQG